MGFLDLFKRRKASVYECVAKGDPLPDEARLAATRKVPWADGAFDGVIGHHMGPSDDDAELQKIMRAIRYYCAAPGTGSRQALYEVLVGVSAVSNADKVLDAVRADDKLDQGRLYEVSQWLVREGGDREPVKLGLAILGAFRQPADEPLFRTLGRHEEFTLFAAIALANVAADPEEAMWELACHVTGWGRVQIIERLEKTQNAKIKAWLLREGSTNAVMNEYTAYTCAVTGGLKEALSAPTVDRALLTGAGNILQALMSDGPALTLADYDDAEATIDLYLGHVARDGEDLLDFHTAQMIAEQKPAYADRVAKIKADPRWPALARAGLAHENFYEFDKAVRAAAALGLDTWDQRWARLQAKPLDAQRWWYMVKETDPERFRKLVAFAEASLPLAKVATGPGDEMGFGPEFAAESCLEYLMQGLGAYPTLGEPLIEAASKSRVTRLRNAAAKVRDERRERLANTTRDQPK